MGTQYSMSASADYTQCMGAFIRLHFEVQCICYHNNHNKFINSPKNEACQIQLIISKENKMVYVNAYKMNNRQNILV